MNRPTVLLFTVLTLFIVSDISPADAQIAGNLVQSDVQPAICRDEVRTQLTTLDIRPVDLPIGTIITSILDVSHFPCTVSGTWVLANGGVISRNQKLESLFRFNLNLYSALVDLQNNRMHIPNLQGVFLRGRDYAGNRDDKGNPEPTRLGEYQSDQFKEHTHTISPTYPNAPHAPNLDAGRQTHGSIGWSGYPDAVSRAAGGRETRPRNVTVNFFIRVN